MHRGPGPGLGMVPSYTFWFLLPLPLMWRRHCAGIRIRCQGLVVRLLELSGLKVGWAGDWVQKRLEMPFCEI